jgi:anthranilate/para-aminobenzoate synthase component II
MNWLQLVSNIVAVAGVCFAHQAITQGAGAAAVSPATYLSVGICLAANLAGLFQAPPNVPQKTGK